MIYTHSVRTITIFDNHVIVMQWETTIPYQHKTTTMKLHNHINT